MDNNLSRVTKVFFAAQQAESWKFKTAEIIPYGISSESFYITNPIETRNKKALLLNFNKINNDGVRILSQILNNNNIPFDVITELPYNAQHIREIFNQYSLCVELSEKNISNVLVAISCGCLGLCYDANDLGMAYSSVPNLYFGKTIYDMANGVSTLLQNGGVQNHTDYFNSNFNFDTFKNKIKDLTSKLNRETFYL